jgi:hypothetical protein
VCTSPSFGPPRALVSAEAILMAFDKQLSEDAVEAIEVFSRHVSSLSCDWVCCRGKGEEVRGSTRLFLLVLVVVLVVVVAAVGVWRGTESEVKLIGEGREEKGIGESDSKDLCVYV